MRRHQAVAALLAEGFFSRLSFGVISLALPLYAHRLGMSLIEIGVLISANLTVAAGLKPLGGWIADRVGFRRSLLWAMALRSMVAGLLVFAAAPWHLFAVRALHGVSVAMRDPSVDALLAETGTKKTVASRFAWYQTAKSAAGSLGKAVAGLLLTLSAGRYPLVFAVAFALSALPFWVVARAVPSVPPQGRVVGAVPALGERVRRLAPYAGFGFLVAATADMLHGLLPLLAVEYAGLSEAETGAVFLAATLVTIVAGPLFGWVSDNVSHKAVLSIRAAANAFSSLVFLAVPNLGGFTGGKMVDEVGKAAFRPAWGALMAKVAEGDPSSKAQTMSVMSVGEDAGAIVGPILAGMLWSVGGVPALLLTRAGLALLTELYTLRLRP